VKVDRLQFARRHEDDPTHRAGRHIMGIGRFVPKKGFVHLVEAFALLAGRYPECRLLLVGDGPERGQLSLLAERLLPEGTVEFLAWRGPEAVERLLGEAAMLVVPSVVAPDGDRDGIPNVIFEAFAVGTPVVATRLPSIAEAIEHNVNGILIEPDDVEGIASAIERLLLDPHWGRELARHAFETLARRFDLDRNTSQLAQLFLGVS